MSITRVGPFAFGYTMPSASMNQIDLNTTYGLDKRASQSDTLNSVITVSSSGSMTFTNASSITMQSSATLEIQSTAILLTDSGSHSTFNGNVNLGALTTFVTGSSFNGNMSFTGSSTLSTVGSYTVSSGTNISLTATDTMMQYSVNSKRIDFCNGGGTVLYTFDQTNNGFDVYYPATSSGSTVTTSITGQATSASSGTGGSFSLAAGQATGTSATGGIMVVAAGNSTGTSGVGGALALAAGNATNTSGIGGNVSMFGGASATGIVGGHVVISPGHGGTSRGNIALNTQTVPNFQGGQGIVYLGNDTLSPSSAPVGGCYLWTDGVHLYCWIAGAGASVTIV